MEENKVLSSTVKEEPKQAYTWGLVTYETEEKISAFCREQGRNWAFAKHDKEGEPHTHVVITFEQRKSFQSVMRLAKTYLANGNTFAQPVKDIGGALLYLTHETDEATKAGKYQYNREIVKYSSKDFYTKYVKGEEVSDTEQFVNDLLCPKEQFSVVRLAKRYGRDFIKNVKAYIDFRSMALAEETGTNALDYHYQAYATYETDFRRRMGEEFNSLVNMTEVPMVKVTEYKEKE